jgi:hypothetical protein
MLAWFPAANMDLLQWWASRPCPKATQWKLLTSIFIFRCIWQHYNDVVLNGAQPDVDAIEVRITEDKRWHLARLFHSDFFGFPEPMPWIGGA